MHRENGFLFPLPLREREVALFEIVDREGTAQRAARRAENYHARILCFRSCGGFLPTYRAHSFSRNALVGNISSSPRPFLSVRQSKMRGA